MARIFFIGLIVLFAAFMLWLTRTAPPESDTTTITDPNEGVVEVASWNMYTPPSGKFRVFFPSLPQTASSKVVDSVTKKNKYFTTFVSPKDDGSAYMVNVISFIPKEALGDEQQAVTNAIQEMVDANPENRLIEMKEGNFKNLKAYDFLVENGTVELVGKAFIKDKQLYMLTMVAPLGTENMQEFAFFINSFEPINR